MRALLAFSPGDLPRAEEMGRIPALDPGILGFTLALSIVTGTVFGLLPAIQVSRADLTGALKETGGRTGTISVVLLCGGSSWNGWNNCRASGRRRWPTVCRSKAAST